MKSVAWLGSFATILGVSISNMVHFWSDSSFVVKLFFIFVLLGAVCIGIVDIHTWWTSRAKLHKDSQSANAYMLKLLKRGGAAALFANNLSWVREAPEINEYLKSQANHGRDICLFVPEHNDLTMQLAEGGVKVRTYPALDYEPSARFTLLNPNEAGSSLLAVGSGIFPKFYIEEFSDQSHPRVIAVARDLLRILEKVSDLVDA